MRQHQLQSKADPAFRLRIEYGTQGKVETNKCHVTTSKPH